MDLNLKGKRCLITGASRGIGECAAEMLAAEGCKVTILARRENLLMELADRIESNGLDRPSIVAMDITDKDAPKKIRAAANKAMGGVDILVNSAGIFVPTPAGDTKSIDMNSMIDVNLKGTLNTINAVVPHMKKRKKGNIINMASVAGVRALPLYGVYCASKAGVVMLTKVLATELSRDGIHVNSISPGNTETPMNETIRTDPEWKPILDFMQKLTPSGKTYSSAEEIANTALFLASPRTGNPIYGANFVIDEGFAAGLFVAD